MPTDPFRIPEALLDGIAERPDDPGAWEVLADFLLEHDHPSATLARCELELLKGMSNPELMGALSAARRERPRLPFEPWDGFDCQWRCGQVVRLDLASTLTLEQLSALLAAPPLRGLHQLTCDDASGQRPPPDDGGAGLLGRLTHVLRAVTPHLRRFTLTLGTEGPPAPDTVARVLTTLAAELPGKVERVDLCLGALQANGVEPLLALARRVKQLDLDGTRLTISDDALTRVVEGAPETTFLLGGTWRSERDWAHPRVQWLPPEAVGWLEHEQTGVVIPLTPLHAHDDYRAKALPQAYASLRRELMGWFSLEERGERLVEDGASLHIAGAEWRLHLR